MPLYHKIHEKLNLILYVGEGTINASDFYTVESRLLAENRQKPGRITLVDVIDVAITFSWDDINTFLDHLKSMARYQAGPYIMITRDKGLHLLAQATNLIISKADLQIHVYYNMEDAISACELSEHKQEILQMWHECKSEFLSSKTP
jgi:hypothetical protein